MKELAYPYKCLNILGNKLRTDIINIIQKKPSTVLEICNQLKKEQSTVSHALQQLRECHFVDFEQKGKERKYYLASEIFTTKTKPIFELVEEHVKKYCVVKQ